MKLLFLGTSNGTCEMVRYAKSQKIYTIVTDYLTPEKSVAKLIADEYWMINTSDIDSLEKKCKANGVTAAFCGVSERNLTFCIELCRRLNLPFYCTKEARSISFNKAVFKQKCREIGAPVAKDYFISDEFREDEVCNIEYPVVVKPVDQAANLGISFCNNLSDLKDAFKLVRKVSTNPAIVVERMLHGEEWFSTYAIKKGKVRFLSLNAMYHEPGYPSSLYCITTTATHHVEQYLSEINPKIEELLQYIGCTEGYAWVQVMRDDDDGKFYIIEMGYRLDGDLLYLPLKNLINYDVTKAMIDFACGIEDDDNKLPEPQCHAMKKCGVGQRLWTKKACTITGIEGFDKIAEIPGVNVEMRRHIGDHEDEYRPLGTITYTSEDIDDMIQMINKINDIVHVYDENHEDILVKFTDTGTIKKAYYAGLKGN